MKILYIIGIAISIIAFVACFIYAFCIQKWISKKHPIEISLGLIVTMICSMFSCLILAFKLINK